jgi:hypothetical protein
MFRSQPSRRKITRSFGCGFQRLHNTFKIDFQVFPTYQPFSVILGNGNIPVSGADKYAMIHALMPSHQIGFDFGAVIACRGDRYAQGTGNVRSSRRRCSAREVSLANRFTFCNVAGTGMGWQLLPRSR